MLSSSCLMQLNKVLHGSRFPRFANWGILGPLEKTVLESYLRCMNVLGRNYLKYHIYPKYWDTLTTVKLQWLEHLWDLGNLFERWVVRTNEIKWCQVRKQMAIISGNVFHLQQNNGMLCVLIRIASMRQF